MIAWLEGEIIQQDDPIIVKTAVGVGYEVYVVGEDFEQIQQQKSFSAYIYSHIKEDQVSYFSFKTIASRKLFMHLISVSGVGPKLAMTMMRSRSAAEITRGIQARDDVLFSGIKGLGKKTVAKILLMLQDRLDPVASIEVVTEHGAVNEDARMALLKLGYSSQKIKDVLVKMRGGDRSTSDIIRQALIELSE